MRRENEFEQQMLAQFRAGTWPPGTHLPTQRELAQEYGCDVRDVRNAMQRLEAAGWVRIRQKSGMVALDPQPVRRQGIGRYARHRWDNGVAPLESDTEKTAAQPRQVSTVHTVAADAEVAAALTVSEGSAVVRRTRRVSDQHEQPTHVVTSWYRADDVIATAIMNETPGTAGRGGGLAVLHEQGLTPHNVREDLATRPPTADEAEILDISLSVWVTELWRWIYTESGRPIEYAYGLHNALRFSWSYQFEVPA